MLRGVGMADAAENNSTDALNREHYVIMLLR